MFADLWRQFFRIRADLKQTGGCGLRWHSLALDVIGHGIMHLHRDLLSCQSATNLISVIACTESRESGEIVGLGCELWIGCAGPGAYHRAG